MKKTLVLSLGSNLGNRYGYLHEAINAIESQFQCPVLRSNTYATPPWGEKNQPGFLNTAVSLQTDMEIDQILQHLQAIEIEMGRVKTKKWGPRNIDIDILLYGDLVLKSDHLSVPHPHFHERSFVLVPLCDIHGDLIHPVLNQTVNQLQQALPNDTSLFAKSANRVS